MRSAKRATERLWRLFGLVHTPKDTFAKPVETHIDERNRHLRSDWARKFYLLEVRKHG